MGLSANVFLRAATALVLLGVACDEQAAEVGSPPGTSRGGSSGSGGASNSGGRAGAAVQGGASGAAGLAGAKATGGAAGLGGLGGFGGGDSTGTGGSANQGGAGTAGGSSLAGAGGQAGGPSAGAAGSTSTGGGAGGESTAGASGTGGTDGGGGAGGAPVPEPCPRVQVHVAAGAKLNVRSEPSTKGTVATQLEDGTIVDVLAEVAGETINGTSTWFHIKSGAIEGYVFGAYATCTEEKPPVVAAPDGFYLPLVCGKSAKIAQGNGGSFSHSGKSYYAFDFSLGLDTPMTAMADGVVKYLYDKTGPGDKCYNGGPDTCFPYANYVVLKHGDGTMTTYKHLNRVDVKLGQTVKRGTVIGLSGSTGYSTGPHAHVMRMNDCGAYQCLSIPLQFQDVSGDHVPNQGQTVTSGNCP